MILQSLYQLYDRLAKDASYEVAAPGYSPQKISFRIILKPDGTLFAIKDARIKDEKSKLQSEPRIVLGEAKSPGAGLNPGLLWDNTAYMLGYKPDDDNPERTQKTFQSFRDKHLHLEKEINVPEFSVVCRFLESWTTEKAEEYAIAHPEMKELTTGFGLFEIQGDPIPVNEHPGILQWWDSQSAQEDGDIGQCLITGENQPIARLHPKIKSVAGAQSAGASIVSFNAPAYESYEKEQSYNAPVSETAAFKYGTALNSLLTGPKSSKHRIRIGDSTCVFWTDEPSIVEDAFPFFASDGSNAQDEAARSKIETFLQSLRQGTEVLEELGEDTQKNQFHILGLAPNAARLSVRFYFQSSVADFIRNLRAHHHDIGIVREWETARGNRLPDPEFPANWQLLRETARVSEEIPPLLGGALMRSILENTPYPEGIYSAVIRRIRADRSINYFRAAILKGTLIRNHKQTIPTMLDTTNTDEPYLLGRLFATLEKTQTEALGDLNAGLRDKYYGSASATPASVFPRIIRTYQHHLSHLEGGRRVNREKLVQEIMSHINEFPSHLNLKAQGNFAIGYYHQHKDFYTTKPKPEETTTTA
jgi:CRISPR-associated protein Csd1